MQSRHIFLALALATASGALAECPAGDTPAPRSYAELRGDYASINEAVAALPNSDLHGTFNRFSALHLRSQVEPLCNGQSDSLPENWERNMDATIEDLIFDLKDIDWATLTDREIGAILQVANIEAIRRNVALYNYPTNDFDYPCAISNDPEHPCLLPLDPDPAIYNRIDSLISSLRRGYTQLRIGDEADLPQTPSSMNGNTVEDIIGNDVASLTIKGVESIDD